MSTITHSAFSETNPPQTDTIAIIGQGYVGLPLSLIFSESGVRVIAIDIDDQKISRLERGESYIRHIPDQRIKRAVDSATLVPTSDITRVSESFASIICVPTPLDRYRQPDTSFVEKTLSVIAHHLPKGSLVSIESTVYPGFTTEIAATILSSDQERAIGTDLFLAFSPEREDPGSNAAQVKKIPKLVGGMTPKCCEIASNLYRRAIDTVIPVRSCAVAEAAKLAENIFRSVNIALVNEMKIIFDKMGIDVWDVIDAAKTKPFGYMPFYPGPGLGGHCIPIDPFYLSWKAREYGISTRFIELAGEINHAMPDYVVDRLTTALNHKESSLAKSRVLIVGIAYKPDVDDMRESPALAIIDKLHERNAIVDYHDPHIPIIPDSRQHPGLAGQRSVDWTRNILVTYDAAIITTNHSAIDFSLLIGAIDCIVDTRNAMAFLPTDPGTVWKA